MVREHSPVRQYVFPSRLPRYTHPLTHRFLDLRSPPEAQRVLVALKRPHPASRIKADREVLEPRTTNFRQVTRRNSAPCAILVSRGAGSVLPSRNLMVSLSPRQKRLKRR
jgi:hypothetical protein